MSATTMEEAREHLSEKRNQFQEWLQTAPEEERSLVLGPSTDAAIQSHIQTISDSIDQIDAGTLGTCEVCHESVEMDRLAMDYTCCVCLDHYSTAEVRELERELELAQTVQLTLLPQSIPELPGMKLAAYSRPAQIVGGDYFDFAVFEDGRTCLAIADVAGHGVSASLHMASIQAMLRSIVPSSSSPAEVAGKIHKLFVHNINFTTFVTFFICAIDSQSRTLTYCNAGHNPPMLFRRQNGSLGSSFLLNPTGPAIGLIEEAEFDEESMGLQSDDLLLMYTDGLVEATDPDRNLFGIGNVRAVFEETFPITPERAVGAVRQRLESFVQGNRLADDTTILACGIE